MRPEMNLEIERYSCHSRHVLATRFGFGLLIQPDGWGSLSEPEAVEHEGWISR